MLFHSRPMLPRRSTLQMFILRVGGRQKLAGKDLSDGSGVLGVSAGVGRSFGSRVAFVVVRVSSDRWVVLRFPPGGAPIVPYRSELPELSGQLGQFELFSSH